MSEYDPGPSAHIRVTLHNSASHKRVVRKDRIEAIGADGTVVDISACVSRVAYDGRFGNAALLTLELVGFDVAVA